MQVILGVIVPVILIEEVDDKPVVSVCVGELVDVELGNARNT